MELHILTFIEQCSGLQGRRRCLAAGVLDIWHGTDPPDLGTARHGTSLGNSTNIDVIHLHVNDMAAFWDCSIKLIQT